MTIVDWEPTNESTPMHFRVEDALLRDSLRRLTDGEFVRLRSMRIEQVYWGDYDAEIQHRQELER